MDWIKSCFRNPEFSGQGSLIRLSDPNDNYTKKTEFMSATLAIKNKELYIKNDDFDPEQQQVSCQSFPLTADAQLIHYSISDDGIIIDCVKWVNIQSKGSFDSFFGFEFEDEATFKNFALQVSKYVKLDEEGFQDPDLRTTSLKSAIERFKLSVENVPSDISKQQVLPEAESEEKEPKKLVFMKEALYSLSHLYSTDCILFMSAGDLYMLGPSLASPVLTDPGIGVLVIRHPGFKVSLDIVRESQIVMRVLINKDFYSHIDCENKKISWVEPLNQSETRTWRADLIDSADSLEAIFNVAKFESEKQISISDLSEEDQKWVKGENEEKSDVSDHEEKIDLDLEDPLPLLQDQENDTINDSVLGWRSSKVFASRKGKFCLYSNTDQQVRKDSVIEVNKNPTSMLLQKGDTGLLFLTEDVASIIYKLDIERGVIVSEFSVKDKEFIQLCHQNKLGSLSESEVFVGLCEKSVMTIDPRVSNSIVQEYTYSTNPGFTCVATTEHGYTAVASSKGEIRLYKEIGKKSTTNFPGLGSGIKSIDSTKNGEWLLATTSAYLMVIKTKLAGDLAYTKASARKRKPPKKLELRPEDISQYGIVKVDFSPAKFNVGESGDETSIITSTGKLVIVWNFLSVKAGKVQDYCVKSVEERVVKNEFKYGEECAVITYPKTITVQNSRWNPRRVVC